jgi:hypothetical protein
MIAVIEASGDVSVQHVFRLAANPRVDRLECIMSGPAWAESVPGGFALGFPFRFQGLFPQRLVSACSHGGNAKRSLLRLTWLRNPYPPHRGGLAFVPVLRVEGLGQFQPFDWLDSGYAIHTGGVFPSVILCYPPNCQQVGRL